MALPPTEVRYKKTVLYFVLGVCSFMIVVMTVMFFIAGIVPVKTIILPYLLALGIISLVGYTMYKRFTNPLPVLVFESDGLRFPHKNDRFIPWRTITEWNIRRHKNNYTLTIRTAENKTRLDITWLDQPTKEINRLIETYLRQPGPGGYQR